MSTVPVAPMCVPMRASWGRFRPKFGGRPGLRALRPFCRVDRRGPAVGLHFARPIVRPADRPDRHFHRPPARTTRSEGRPTHRPPGRSSTRASAGYPMSMPEDVEYDSDEEEDVSPQSYHWFWYHVQEELRDIATAATDTLRLAQQRGTVIMAIHRACGLARGTFDWGSRRGVGTVARRSQCGVVGPALPHEVLRLASEVHHAAQHLDIPLVGQYTVCTPGPPRAARSLHRRARGTAPRCRVCVALGRGRRGRPGRARSGPPPLFPLRRTRACASPRHLCMVVPRRLNLHAQNSRCQGLSGCSVLSRCVAPTPPSFVQFCPRSFHNQ